MTAVEASKDYKITKKYKKRSKIEEIWRRLKRDRLAMFGLFMVILLVFLAIFADFIVDYETEVIKNNVPKRLQGPSKEHWLGTDELGRDILARLIYGSRISLSVGLVSVSISLVIGVTLGAIAGYYGGHIDNLIMRVADVFIAIPSILLAITIASVLGQNLLNLMIAVAISNIPQYIRITRASVLTVKDQEFVEAAKAIGAKNHRIILYHIIPNCMAPIIVQSTLRVAGAILATSSLSFLGLGVKPPIPEWGSMSTIFLPLNITSPSVGSISRKTALPVVDLPQPDSPTIPKVFPFPIEKDISSTALRVPCPVLKYFLRFFTSKIISFISIHSSPLI
jgi:peptide/nickel transport system permease protein